MRDIPGLFRQALYRVEQINDNREVSYANRFA